MRKTLLLKPLSTLLLGVAFFGCVGYQTSPVMDEAVNYQRDVTLHVAYKSAGKWGPYYLIQGAGVMPKADGYKIKVYPPGKADMITVSSCHREWKTPNPEKQGGWFKAGFYEFEIPFKDSIDNETLCSFDVGIYEKNKGRHAWGLLAISDAEKYKLPAKIRCNGQEKQYAGTSVCQAKQGLIQGYDFDRQVSVTKVVGCEIANLKTKEPYSKNWLFLMPSGECEIFFIDIKNPMGFVHQAFLFGYDTIPIRGIE